MLTTVRFTFVLSLVEFQQEHSQHLSNTVHVHIYRPNVDVLLQPEEDHNTLLLDNDDVRIHLCITGIQL